MKKLHSWFHDRVIRRILKNSSYLILSNLISVFLTIYITRLLGPYYYGVLGIITSYVTNVNKIFSFRMNEMVVHYVGAPYEKGDYVKTGALIKFAGAIEGLTSVVAFIVMLLTAKFGAALFLEDPTLTNEVVLYGLSILGGCFIESANGVLRIINKYRAVALVSLVQNVIVLIVVLIAGNLNLGLHGILSAYLIGKILLGVIPVLLTLMWLPKRIGKTWWKAPLSVIDNKRDILKFTFSTNISNTVNLIARDGEILWIGALLSPLYAGYYKTAMTVINMVLTPINPFIDTTYPEMVRAIAREKWADLKRILSRVTVISGSWTGAVFAGLLLLGKPLLFQPFSLFGREFQVFSSDYLPAYPLILILLVGYGTANVLFWNRTLLLAFGEADYAMKVSVAVMIVKVILTVTLVPDGPYPTEAWILSFYLASTVVIMTVRGLGNIRRRETARG